MKLQSAISPAIRQKRSLADHSGSSAVQSSCMSIASALWPYRKCPPFFREKDGRQILVELRHHAFKAGFDSGPFAIQNAVIDRMAIRSIGHNDMIAQHALFDGSDAFDGAL